MSLSRKKRPDWVGNETALSSQPGGSLSVNDHLRAEMTAQVCVIVFYVFTF
jgi:hypothetical protein